MRLVLLAFALTGAAAAQVSEHVAVNLYAEVRSADGYLNLRDGPGTTFHVLGRLQHGERVTVLDCQRRRRGRRWCRVLHGARVGFVFDAELAYRRATRPTRSTAAGTGLARGFVAEEDPNVAVRRVRSRDGYVNLRSGPSARHRVLRRMPNGESVEVVAFDANGRASGTWLLVVGADGTVGYAYDAELALHIR